ncbi:unnamed protein product [Orchesella dallaii]|uniref:Uncharacterized protein n=1 Tax=Orchesella dallaii TaxID=48710 RepID=A0ABP1RZ88_9HEXA
MRVDKDKSVLIFGFLPILLILLYQNPGVECTLKPKEKIEQGARLTRASGSGPGGHLRQPRKSYLAKIVEQGPETTKENDADPNPMSPKPLTAKQIEEMIDPLQQAPRGRSISGSSKKSPRQAEPPTADKNWYVYKPDGQFGRMLGANTGGGGSGSGSGGSGGGYGSAGGGTSGGSSTSSTGGKGGGAWSSKKGAGGAKGGGGSRGGKPYNVKLLQRNKVDPAGYSFFQYRPDAKVGVVWHTKNPFDRDGRMDLNGGAWNGSADIDDMDEANTYDWEFRRYDRACLYIEYKVAKKIVTPPSIPLKTLSIVKDQNTLLARRFLEWTFEKKADEAELLAAANPNSQFDITFEFLAKTKEIFLTKICRNASDYAYASAATTSSGVAVASNTDPDLLKGTDVASFLPDSFVQLLYNLFMVLRDITSTKNTMTEYPSKEDKEAILDDILKECSEKEPSIHWFKHSCGDQVLSYDQKNNYACTPMPDYDFNPRLYDPVLDTIWHMFNAVHGYCFEHFQKQPRMWHRYALIMANTFTQQMRMRWTASVASESFYMRLLGPEYPVYLETINRCMYGAVLRSDATMLLPRFDTPSPIDFAPV